MWENYGDDLFLLVWRHTFIGHNPNSPCN